MFETTEKLTKTRQKETDSFSKTEQVGETFYDTVWRKQYSVILFDEMEKAHHDVFNIMLQMLDDGHVTHSKGHVVNFRNTVVIFTSNVCSQDILNLNGSIDVDSQQIMRDRVTNTMKEKVCW